MQRTQEPLEPARQFRCSLALQEWTVAGLARGYLATTVDERLPVGKAIDVLGGIPGEIVEIEVSFPAIWRPKQRKRARPPLVRLRRVIQAAPQRVAAPCPVFGDCGGCRLQQIPYEEQLAWKQARVQQEMGAALLDAACVLPTQGMAHPWNFRNQMRFAIDRMGRAGLTALDTHRVIPLTTCPIAHPLINDALAAVQAVPQPRPQLLLRCGAHTGEVLMQPAPDAATCEALTTASITVQTAGLHEKLGGLEFAMRPSSFFQTNTAQAEVMMAMVLAKVPGGPDVTVADAYCGVGTFAALLAGRAGQVIAIEESASAVADARANLAQLGLTNITLIQGKTETVLPALTSPIDAIVLDPPRLGCLRPVLEAIAARHIPRVVYVSCDPATLARDLALLCHDIGAYQVVSVQPLDMFPQTYHIECVAVLDWVG